MYRVRNHCFVGALSAALYAHAACADDDLRGVRQLAAGTSRTCAVLSDGTAACWGENSLGQLGNGRRVSSPTPTQVILDASSRTPLRSISAIATGDLVTCALRTVGDVWCWGDGSSGSLGYGLTQSSAVPVRTTMTAATAIAVGSAHVCAILANPEHSVRCWGANSRGQLGNGTTTNSLLPTDVVITQSNGLRPLLTDVVQLTASGNTTCATRADSTIACWGENANGQLGNGSTTIATSPTTVVISNQDRTKTVLSGIGQTSVGSHHVCAVFSYGAAACWGSNSYGELGDPLSPAIQPSPVGVNGLSGVLSVSNGWDYTCALLQYGHLACWGRNDSYQMADTIPEHDLPARLPDSIVAVQLAVGFNHTCVLTPDTTVRCWGAGVNGQLGDGADTPRTPTPVTIRNGDVDDDIFASGMQYLPN